MRNLLSHLDIQKCSVYLSGMPALFVSQSVTTSCAYDSCPTEESRFNETEGMFEEFVEISEIRAILKQVDGEKTAFLNSEEKHPGIISTVRCLREKRSLHTIHPVHIHY